MAKQQATVFHPETGERKVVTVGDPNAFSGGFQLETPTDKFIPPSTSTINDPTTTGSAGGLLPTGNQPTPQTNQADIFNQMMMSSLKTAQGVNTVDLLKRKRELQRSELDIAQAPTPENLRQLSPGQQGQLRGANLVDIRGQIDQNAVNLFNAETAISNWEKTFEKMNALGTEFTAKLKAPESVIDGYVLAIQNDPDSLTAILASAQNDATRNAIIAKIDFTQMASKEDVNIPSISEQLKASEAGFDIVDGRIKAKEIGTGEITTTTINDREANLDSATTASIQTIDNALKTSGATVNGQTGLILGDPTTSSLRTAEQQRALFDQGVSQLDGSPGNESMHQKGLAIDVFPDQAYVDQITPIMNANGWQQTAADIGDNVHFEFQGAGAGSERAQKDAILAQISNGLLTKGDATDIREQFANDPAFLTEITKAFTDPKNKTITETQATKFNVDALTTKGQLDKIISNRQANGFGNKTFQSVGTKEYDNIIGWLEMQEDLNSIGALKQGSEFIQTLSPEEQQRIFDEFSEDFGVDSVAEMLKSGDINTGFFTGRTLGLRENIPGQSGKEKRQTTIDIISGKYTVDFMKQISGVAISAQEAARLQRLVPGIRLQDARFVKSNKDAIDTLNVDLIAAAKKFGFTSIDELRIATEQTKAGAFFDVDDQIDNQTIPENTDDIDSFLNSF